MRVSFISTMGEIFSVKIIPDTGKIIIIQRENKSEYTHWFFIEVEKLLPLLKDEGGVIGATKWLSYNAYLMPYI